MSTHTPLKCFIDSTMPGILRFADDPTAGLLAGIRAPAIMEALNSHDRLTAEVARLREALQEAIAYFEARNLGATAEILLAKLKALNPEEPK